ncbi:MAG: chemotaxis protein CheA [Desulfuromonadales bacterium]|nr:chemotaxis protein CheA [Desulfuromonadales bacterium]
MNMSQYRDLFVSESHRHLEAFNELIVQLESSGDPNIVHELFRHAHSLKGMAATMQFDRISGLAHKLEDLLAKVRDGEFSPDRALVNLLLEGGDLLACMVAIIEEGSDTPLPDSDDLINRITGFTPDAGTVPEPKHDDDEHQPEPLLRQPQFRQSDSFKTVRVKTETLDRMVNITGELITTHHRLADQLRTLPGTNLNEPLAQLSSQLRELRDEVFLARMLPFAMVADRFPRLVRDLSHSQGKEATLRISDGDIELDRGILENIAEPLMHILRNAVDHGMEAPHERMAAGKPRSGQISLTLERDKDYVTIVVCDDGRGMDPALLAAKAMDRGLISAVQAAALSAREAFMLICNPGFSTAETVTDISGRGVGMDAVKSAVRSLGGTLSIESVIGQGSRFNLKLPLTVSIIQALLVECGALTIAFPVTAVDRTLELTPNAIFTEEGRHYCRLDGASVPLWNLHPILGQPLPSSVCGHIPVIVCRINGKVSGLIVDHITGQREVFVKPLGKPFSHLKHATGGAVMGNGRIVFIMDINTFTTLR